MSQKTNLKEENFTERKSSSGLGEKEISSLRVYAFNPNGIRALTRNNFEKENCKGHLEAFIKQQRPDILFFPETKGNLKTEAKTQADLTKIFESVDPRKWTWYWSYSAVPGRHGNAVAIADNVQIEEVRCGWDKKIVEEEGRIISLKVKNASLLEGKGLWIVGLYVPNASTGLKRLDYKLEWLTRLRDMVDSLRDTGNSVIILGDINVAPDDSDISNPKTNLHSAGFTVEEKECFAELFNEEYFDVWRKKYPTFGKNQGRQGIYTYWNTQYGARNYNSGWRIDLVLMDRETWENNIIRDIMICPQYHGSDHCPIGIDVQLLDYRRSMTDKDSKGRQIGETNRRRQIEETGRTTRNQVEETSRRSRVEVADENFTQENYRVGITRRISIEEAGRRNRVEETSRREITVVSPRRERETPRNENNQKQSIKRYPSVKRGRK